MLKIIMLLLLLGIVVILAVALKSLFKGDKKALDRSLQLRVGVSIFLILLILLAYGLGEIGVASSVQYL